MGIASMRPMLAADVSLTDVSAFVIAIASVIAVVLLVVVVVSVYRTLAIVRLSVEQMRRETLPMIEDLHKTVHAANAELERVDALLDSATSVTSTVDSASHLLYLAVSNPLIKAIAFAAGTSRAARALRRS